MNSAESHKDLIARIARGEEPALRELYHLYSSKVYNTALSYVQNKSDAEEITQDVFLKIFNAAPQFEGKSGVNTWIYRIVIHTALDYLTYRTRQKRFGVLLRFFKDNSNEPANEIPDFDHPGILLEKKEDARLLFKAIEQLPEQQKTAFILSYLEDLPRKEVAEIMHISLKAVESLLQRAKNQLRKKV